AGRIDQRRARHRPLAAGRTGALQGAGGDRDDARGQTRAGPRGHHEPWKGRAFIKERAGRPEAGPLLHQRLSPAVVMVVSASATEGEANARTVIVGVGVVVVVVVDPPANPTIVPPPAAAVGGFLDAGTRRG